MKRKVCLEIDEEKIKELLKKDKKELIREILRKKGCLEC